MSEHTVYLVLGTNLGNRYKNLSNARSEINNLPKTKILKKSKIYKSSFYGPIEQPFFFNLALKIKTQLSPISLLKHLQKVEKKLKREKNSHMKPRTIDIDIIFFDDLLNQPQNANSLLLLFFANTLNFLLNLRPFEHFVPLLNI